MVKKNQLLLSEIDQQLAFRSEEKTKQFSILHLLLLNYQVELTLELGQHIEILLYMTKRIK